MRWEKCNPKINDIRIERKFLFLPMRIDDECRWLEFARIEYKFLNVESRYVGGSYYSNEWVKIKFVD